jgi:hypothetical protein
MRCVQADLPYWCSQYYKEITMVNKQNPIAIGTNKTQYLTLKIQTFVISGLRFENYLRIIIWGMKFNKYICV